MCKKLTFLLVITSVVACAGTEQWHSDTFVIWPQKAGAPKQTSVVSFSDWLVFGNAIYGKPGVRFIINTMAASGIRSIWWRTFGGGHAQYSSKVDDVTMANYAGQGANYSHYNSLKDAVGYAHKLGLNIKAWYTPLEEAHAWPDNVRSKYTDLHKNMWDVSYSGVKLDAPSFFYKKYRDYKLALAREMLCDYDTDGIVIDFERRGAPCRNDQWGYLPQVIQGFNRKYNRSGKPKINDSKWLAYRADFIGKFMRGVKNIAKKQRQRPAEVTAIFPVKRSLTAHYNIPKWCRDKTIDSIGLIAHGSSWGAPSGDLAKYKAESEKYSLPVSVILYSLKGKPAEIEKSFDNAVAGGAKDIIWFETTYLYFNKLHAIPRRKACPVKAELSSPEYNFSQGGEVYLIAAGKWKMRIGEKIISEGDADKVYKLLIPKMQVQTRLHIDCELNSNSSKAGVAIQGKIGDRHVRTDKKWTSRNGKIVTLAQPGIPPFLAPLDSISKGRKK